MPWTIEQLTSGRRGLDFFKEMKGTWRFDSELPRKHLRVFNFTEISPRNCQESRRSSSDGSIVKVPSSKTWNMKPSEATCCKSISLSVAHSYHSCIWGFPQKIKQTRRISMIDFPFFGWPMMTPIYKLWEPGMRLCRGASSSNCRCSSWPTVCMMR